MRTTAERRGQPNRRRAGNYRSEGHPYTPRLDPLNPRRGYPDRSNVGAARQIDRRGETRNRLREQHGFDFDRLVVPTGTTTARPSTPVEGDIRRNGTLGQFEGYNGVDWDNLSSGPAAITFTETNAFVHRHARGAYPAVQVLDSDGAQIELCVHHLDNDTVVLTFQGTITNGVLVLN